MEHLFFTTRQMAGYSAATTYLFAVGLAVGALGLIVTTGYWLRFGAHNKMAPLQQGRNYIARRLLFGGWVIAPAAFLFNAVTGSPDTPSLSDARYHYYTHELALASRYLLLMGAVALIWLGLEIRKNRRGTSGPAARRRRGAQVSSCASVLILALAALVAW